MPRPVIIRPRFGLFVYGAVVVVSLLAVVPLAWQGAWGTLATIAPFPIVLLGVGYVVLVNPAVVFDDDAVELRNPLRRIRVPYPCIRTSSTRRGFTLETDGGVVSAWAAPPPDRLSAERREPTVELRRDPRIARADDGSVASSAAPGSPSGDAALTLADRLRRGAADGDPDAHVARAWNVANVCVLAATAIAAVLAVVLAPR